jgi:hypothetical protein
MPEANGVRVTLREGYGGARNFLPGPHPTLPEVKVDRCVAIEGPAWLQIRGLVAEPGGNGLYSTWLLASFSKDNVLFYEPLP